MSARTILKHVYENGGMTEYQYERIDRVLKERERPHGTCKTCKHYVKGGLDGKTYVCENPNIVLDDYYDYACLAVEENDFCSIYEARKGEGDKNVEKGRRIESQ